MIKTLYSFDFDDTLCYTVRPEVGKDQYEKETGLSWPYVGWWGKSETLDPEIFFTPKNEFVYGKYLEAKSDENGASILATGRLNKVPMMREHIESILNQHNLSFDEIHVIDSKIPNGQKGLYLNWGSDTFKFKTTLFEKLIELTDCEHFVMYDDRHEHLIKFEEWAELQDCKITIFDVKNKQKRHFNSK